MSLSTMTLPTPTSVFSNRERLTFAGGSISASVYKGKFGSYRLNGGCGCASMMFVSKNERTVPMSFQ